VLPIKLGNGNHKVKVRVTVARQQEYIDTGVQVLPAHWNDKADPLLFKWIKAAHPDHKLLNLRLRDVWQEVQTYAMASVPRSAKEIKQLVETKFGLGRNGVVEVLGMADGQPSSEEDFLAYFQDELKRRAVTGNPRSVEKLAGILQKIRLYLAPARQPGQSDEERLAELDAQRMPWTALTGRWLREYADHLTQCGNREVTIHHNLTFIKTIVHRAIEDGKLLPPQNPFKMLKLREPEAAPKTKLSAAQVASMEALVLPPPTRHLRRFSNMELAREAWLLQYFLLGARVGDVLTLRWSAVGPELVTFREQKTGKMKYAPRHLRLDAVLARLSRWASQQPPHPDDFVLPLLDRRAPYAQFPPDMEWQQVSSQPATRATWLLLLRRIESATATLNAGIKLLAPRLGLDPKTMSTHTARHSFANAGRVAGLPAAYMRDLLNHYSVSQTEAYMGQLGQVESVQLARTIYDQPK
jgi:integrase